MYKFAYILIKMNFPQKMDNSFLKCKYFKYTFSYFDEKEKEAQVLNRNIIVLGSRKTGKTKFINLILENKVDLFKYFPTIGVDYRIGLFNYIVSSQSKNENKNKESFHQIRLFIYEISNIYIENVLNKSNNNKTDCLFLIDNLNINTNSRSNSLIYIVFLDLNEMKFFDLSILNKKYKNLYNSEEKYILYIYFDMNDEFQNKTKAEENLFILNMSNFNSIQSFLCKVFDLCL